MKLLHIHNFYIARKIPCLPPRIVHTLLSSISLMMTAYSQEIENNSHANVMDDVKIMVNKSSE